MSNYSITYAVGTTIHDEKHYTTRVPARSLGSKIIALQAQGKRIISVELAH